MHSYTYMSLKTKLIKKERICFIKKSPPGASDRRSEGSVKPEVLSSICGTNMVERKN